MSETARPQLTPTRISQFIRLESCPRFLRLDLHPAEVQDLRDRLGVDLQPLTPLLATSGQRFEETVRSTFQAEGWTVEDLTGTNWEHTAGRLRRVDGPVLLWQAQLTGRLGGWDCTGQADLIGIEPDPAGGLRVRIADIKSSRRDRVEHRVQVACYVRLIEQMAAAAGIPIRVLEGAVIRRPVPGQSIAWREVEPFDLAPYRLALDHVLADLPPGVAEGPAGLAFAQVPYHLTRKCDGCRYNPICFVESGARRDLSLIPYLGPVEKKILRHVGLHSVDEVAALTDPALPGIYQGPLAVSPDQTATVARLRQGWQVGSRIDRITQRARALVRGWGRVDLPREPTIDAPYSSLPSDDAYPGLVKVFLDVQFDYLTDALYLLGAHITGPNGDRTVVELSAGPPALSAESAFLQRWILAVYQAVVAVAGDTSAYVHFYFYDRFEQKVLLDALRRHISDVFGVPAFFDLLTTTDSSRPTTPLAQPLVSFLADEVRDRLTLGLTCPSLHTVAQATGFRWDEEADGRPAPYRQIFRWGLFDNRRPIETEGRRVWIETAARFNSTLPLEYAYAAWGRLPGGGRGDDRRRLAGLRRVTPVELRGFQARRVQALRHIESRIPGKNRYLGKEPIPLPDLAFQAVGPVRLPRALQEFLLIEHYATLHDRVTLFAQPIERRARTGRAVQIECLGLASPDTGLFRTTFAAIGLDPVLAAQNLRLKEGDWVVLNPRADENGLRLGKRVVHGRLAHIVGIESTDPELLIRLKLLAMSFKEDKFRYGHFVGLTPEPGQLYTIDEMADDLSADRLWDACAAAETHGNPLIDHIEAGDLSPQPPPLKREGETRRPAGSPSPSMERGDAATKLPAGDSLPLPGGEGWGERASPADADATVPEASQPPPPVLPLPLQGRGPGGEVTPHAADFARLIDQIDPHPPTSFQREVIAGRLAEPIVLVQGPPGTGKSQTLGWAILARIAAHRRAFPDQPYLVAVSGQTHNAIDIVLRGVAAKLARLRERAPNHSLTQALAGLRLAKLQDDARPDADVTIESLGPRGKRALAALYGAPAAVVGATSPTFHTAVKTLGGKEMDWTRRFFDLLVIDEASQVSLPQAVLASAFLRPAGQILVVGDHRQMPPILSHDWDNEDRRTVKSAEVYRSLFDYLRGRGFPGLALDESFRLPAQLAGFLADIIYHHDDVDFHSKRTESLPAALTGDPYVDAILDPLYPVVVIEHDEAFSQQHNPVEADLIAPIVAACAGRLGLTGSSGLGIVVPHRAQRAALQERFPDLAAAGAIDTVERFQGGERDVIIVSATASDPDYVLAEAEFLLNPNRLNVALSRPRLKLIVIASATLYRLLTADLDIFENATLWKRLRYSFADLTLWQGTRAGATVRVHGRGASLHEHGG